MWHVTEVKHLDMHWPSKDFSWPQDLMSHPRSVWYIVEHEGKIVREQMHVHVPDADVGVEDVVLVGAAVCYMA